MQPNKLLRATAMCIRCPLLHMLYGTYELGLKPSLSCGTSAPNYELVPY